MENCVIPCANGWVPNGGVSDGPHGSHLVPVMHCLGRSVHGRRRVLDSGRRRRRCRHGHRGSVSNCARLDLDMLLLLLLLRRGWWGRTLPGLHITGPRRKGRSGFGSGCPRGSLLKFLPSACDDWASVRVTSITTH